MNCYTRNCWTWVHYQMCHMCKLHVLYTCNTCVVHGSDMATSKLLHNALMRHKRNRAIFPLLHMTLMRHKCDRAIFPLLHKTMMRHKCDRAIFPLLCKTLMRHKCDRVIFPLLHKTLMKHVVMGWHQFGYLCCLKGYTASPSRSPIQGDGGHQS